MSRPVAGGVLTEYQADVLAFIDRCLTRHHRPPAVRDICSEFGFCGPNGAMAHLKALERKGFIVRQRASAAAITIVRRRDGGRVLSGGAWHGVLVDLGGKLVSKVNGRRLYPKAHKLPPGTICRFIPAGDL